MGCFATYGAKTAVVLPNRKEFNKGSRAREKTPALEALMQKANLSPVWRNYCLKSTEVVFTTPDGTPCTLGNSVIEGIVGEWDSRGIILHLVPQICILWSDWCAYSSRDEHLPFNPMGEPIPTVLAGSKTFAFNWGLLTQQP
jgi:hypothetical protein